MSEIAILSEFEDFIEETELLGIALKSYSEVGSVPSPGVGKVAFTAREIVILDERKAVYDVVIDIERSNQHPSNGSASVSYEEVDRLIAGARRLIKGGHRGMSRMKNFEASISSSDGKLRLVVFNAASGSVMSLIEASGVSLFFAGLSKLSDIADCLSKAKQEIDRIKISG